MAIGKDTVAMYNNYRSNTGTSFMIDYERAYKEDGVIKRNIDNEIATMQNSVEGLYVSSGSTSFKAVGGLFRISNGDSENWQKTIGAHWLYGHSNVTVDPTNNSITMTDIYDGGYV